jgi:hypothetical protein
MNWQEKSQNAIQELTSKNVKNLRSDSLPKNLQVCLLPSDQKNAQMYIVRRATPKRAPAHGKVITISQFSFCAVSTA